MNIWLLLLLQAVLIALNAVFACAEIAVLSVSETRLEKLAGEGNARARRLSQLTREPAKFLATIQVAITLSGFLGSAFAADNFSEPLVDWVVGLGVRLPRATLDAIAVVVITLILSYFTLIFGELVPKRVAHEEVGTSRHGHLRIGLGHRRCVPAAGVAALRVHKPGAAAVRHRPQRDRR